MLAGHAAGAWRRQLQPPLESRARRVELLLHGGASASEPSRVVVSAVLAAVFVCSASME